ncbi:MAG: hypothetical protein AB8B78_04945 [Polaribacter sp.]
MKILIIVPDGVGVRNYLFSSFVSSLINENNNIIIYHKLSNSAIKEIKNIKPEIQHFSEIPYFIENSRIRILRESLAYARLVRNIKVLNNNTILSFWTPSKKGIRRKTLYFLAESFGYFLSKSYKTIRKFDKIYDKEILKHKSTELNRQKLLEIKPDFVLNLHQRAPIASPVIAAAKKLNIKTATVIFSWDNIPKGRLISRYDYYYVWSELMKSQLLKLHTEVSSSQIFITGTPQFEFYFDKNNYLEKKDFFSRYGLDENKKTICFSGNDLLSPHEADYLRDICEEVQKIDEENRPQIIFRKCPVDKSNRFEKVLEDYKNLVFSIKPDWKTEIENDDTFISIYPTFNDNTLLVNTIKHSDIIINLGSTMAHDAAVLDTPCLYLNYNPVKKTLLKVEDVFEFEHFRSMKNLEAVGWINSKNEISEKVLFTIKNPENTGKDRKKWLKEIALHPLDKNAEVLKNIVLKCI